jgi:hypothetical protein
MRQNWRTWLARWSRFGLRGRRPSAAAPRRGFRPGVEALEDRLVPAPLTPFLQLQHTLTNPTPASGDHFGWSVSMSGDQVLVGAPDDGTGAAGAGSAYLYDAVTGNLLRTFNNPTPAVGDDFGLSVSLSGNRVLVGAPGDGTKAVGAGSAYLFDAATGNLLRSFHNPTPSAGDAFGWSLSVWGGQVLVGAPYDDTGATDAGSAYLYDAASGSLLHTLNNPAPAATDLFGWSVSMSANQMLAAAPLDDSGAADTGSVYLFDAATANLLHTLNNPTPAVNDGFGNAVSLSGNRVLVGALNDDTGATDAGSAYLFDTTGNLLRTFNNPTPAPVDLFGYAVSLSGDRVLVGTPFDSTGGTYAGSAYLYDGPTGKLLNTLTNPTPANGDQFGYAVSVSGERMLVGAPFDDAGADNAGSAYLFGYTAGPQPVPAPLPQGLSVALRMVKRKGRRQLTVQVRFADDGALRSEFRCPFQPRSARSIRAALVDLDGDGTPDAVQLTARRGARHLVRVIAL